MRLLAALFAATAIVLIGAGACTTDSSPYIEPSDSDSSYVEPSDPDSSPDEPSDPDSLSDEPSDSAPADAGPSDSDSLGDETVGDETDGISGQIEFSQLVRDGTVWPTHAGYELQPEDFIVIDYVEIFGRFNYANYIFIVFDADGSECGMYFREEGKFRVGDNPPQRLVISWLYYNSYFLADTPGYEAGDVFLGSCRVPKAAIVGFGAPKYLADHVSAALDSYERASTESDRARATRESREAQLDRVLARYCFNPPCRVANYSGDKLRDVYSTVDAVDKRAFQDYNEAVYDQEMARDAWIEAKEYAGCWLQNLASAQHINHFNQACGSETVAATATAVAATAIARETATAVAERDFPNANLVTISLDDRGGTYALTAYPASVQAGAVTFYVANDGLIAHEFKIVKLNDAGLAANLSDLSTEAGLISETGNTVEGVGTILGSVLEADLPAGGSHELTLLLEPGEYMLLCNVATHYQLGMWNRFTVT